MGFCIASIFGTCIKFLDLLFLDKFTTVLLALLLSLSTTSFSLVLNVFKAKCDDLIIFNRKLINATILLKH